MFLTKSVIYLMVNHLVLMILMLNCLKLLLLSYVIVIHLLIYAIFPYQPLIFQQNGKMPKLFLFSNLVISLMLEIIVQYLF